MKKNHKHKTDTITKEQRAVDIEQYLPSKSVKKTDIIKARIKESRDKKTEERVNDFVKKQMDVLRESKNKDALQVLENKHRRKEKYGE